MDLGRPLETSNAQTRRVAWHLAILCTIVYSYFFQGGGWNQNSQLDLVRALVEKRSCEISQYASNTGDISLQGKNIFSNKAPGLAVLLAAPYELIISAQTFLGFDIYSTRVAQVNAHILTFLGSALPFAFWRQFRCVVRKRVELIVALLIVPYFFLLNLSMKTWTAGWGVGPRYMLPMLPFLFIFTTPLWRWSRPVFFCLAVPSVLFMFAVSTVGTFMPVPNVWPAPVSMPHPLRWVVRWLKDNQVGVSTQSIFERIPSLGDPRSLAERWDSYNLGELLGLQGTASLVPLLTMVILVAMLLRRQLSVR